MVRGPEKVSEIRIDDPLGPALYIECSAYPRSMIAYVIVLSNTRRRPPQSGFVQVGYRLPPPSGSRANRH
jgi:hypothetical protein